MALFCAVIKRDSNSLLRFSLFSHYHYYKIIFECMYKYINKKDSRDTVNSIWWFSCLLMLSSDLIVTKCHWLFVNTILTLIYISSTINIEHYLELYLTTLYICSDDCIGKKLTVTNCHWVCVNTILTLIYICSIINIECLPGDNTPQGTNYTATCLQSRKLSKLDEPDMQDTAGEAKTSS